MTEEFIRIIKSKIGCGYAWGSQGEVLTKGNLDALIKLYGISHYKTSAYDASQWIGKQCFDCSGLIVWALMQLGLIQSDYTAAGLYGLCQPVRKAELQPGDLCFWKDSSITHVGVYTGSNKVVHARGTPYGVQETDVFSSFTIFGRLKCLTADTISSDTIKEFQRKNGLAADGIVGPKTLAKAREVKGVCEAMLSGKFSGSRYTT